MMDCKLINTNNGSIEYCTTGQGTPVLFVHGGHSNCKEMLCHKGFDPGKYQLITPSRPGYGKTPLGANKTPVQAADLLIELLNILSLEKVIVYAISAGGLTALELASKYPQRVSKLILASSISREWLDKRGKLYKTAKLMFRPGVETVVWGMVRFFAKISPSMIAKSFYPQFTKNEMRQLRKEDIDELVNTMKHYNSKKGFLNDIHQTINDDVIDKITCPTLIIHSENDNSVSLEHAVHTKSMIKTSKIEVLKNEWGHLIWIGKDSNLAIEKVIDFIES